PAPLDREIDAPATAALIQGARAEHFRIHLAADCQQRIANDFGLEAKPRPVPEQAVVPVQAYLELIDGGAFEVHRARHDQFMDRLQAPTALNELPREPIEQFGMTRWLTPAAEFAGRRHDAAAKVMLPEVVDDHPGQ